MTDDFVTGLVIRKLLKENKRQRISSLTKFD